LDPENWKMKKMEGGQQDLKTWIKENMNKGTKIGVDYNLFSHSKIIIKKIDLRA
jgi:hypothetical protein